MNQQQEENAMEKIHGYFFISAGNKSAEQSFNEAKAECLENLRKQIQQIEEIKFGKFEEKYI